MLDGADESMPEASVGANKENDLVDNESVRVCKLSREAVRTLAGWCKSENGEESSSLSPSVNDETSSPSLKIELEPVVIVSRKRNERVDTELVV